MGLNRGNIFGLAFDRMVRKQIEQRESRLSLEKSGLEDTKIWANSKTSFLRLSSSVNIRGSASAARQYILQKGISGYYKLAEV